MLRITNLLLLHTAISLTTAFQPAFLPSACRTAAAAVTTTEQPTTALSMAARKGAMSRKKGFGDADSKSKGDLEKNSTPKDGKIYSLPALYDLAFGYRNFEQEVDFLLYAHDEYAGYPATAVLELAAGPARHSIEALKLGAENSDDGAPPKMERVTAIDMSTEMVDYGKELASHELEASDYANDAKFSYLQGDMRDFTLDDDKKVDTAWILLGSLQHMTTNADVLACFRNIHKSLTTMGTLIIELPHPRETFSMVECTRNGWEVPLEDENGSEYGELAIVWGDEDDAFDPITQVRQFSVSMELKADVPMPEGMQSVKEVVPMRQFTAQEISALATCSGFEVAAMFGALDEEVTVNDDDEAFRLVCVLCKQPSDMGSLPVSMDDDIDYDDDDFIAEGSGMVE